MVRQNIPAIHAPLLVLMTYLHPRNLRRSHQTRAKGSTRGPIALRLRSSTTSAGAITDRQGAAYRRLSAGTTFAHMRKCGRVSLSPSRHDRVPQNASDRRPWAYRPPRSARVPARHQGPTRLRSRGRADRGQRRDPALAPGPAPGRYGQQARDHARDRPRPPRARSVPRHPGQQAAGAQPRQPETTDTVGLHPPTRASVSQECRPAG